ncbi:hypothetical protein ACFPYI_04530 [Halomarina salina]|uniref:Uncharacterized protein n=1 Tax=Halomarina salina TaxID=1872699 RepID=A0ABD5RJP8_9EURY|nr:hypothetical protein [Halomarina salina]
MSSQEQFQTPLDREPRAAHDADTETEQQSPDAAGRVVAVDDESLAESEVTVTQGDGWLASLTVRPRVECAWSGFDEAPSEVGATLLVRVDGETCFDPVATELLPLDEGIEGTTALEFDDAHDVVENTTLDAVDFEPPWRTDRPRTRTLTLRLVVDLLDDDGIPLCGDVATVERDVVVEAGDDAVPHRD